MGQPPFVRGTTRLSQFGTASQFSLTIALIRSRQTIQSSQARSVWRVLPVGTGRCLPNSRVAFQPLGFNSLALSSHSNFQRIFLNVAYRGINI